MESRQESQARTLRPSSRQLALLLDLLECVEWPFETRTDTIWLQSPADHARDGATLAVGARLFETRAEIAIPNTENHARGLPFRGLQLSDSGGETRGILRLEPRVAEGLLPRACFDLQVRLASSRIAPENGDPIERALVARGHERGRSLVLHFDNLDELLPNADLRAAFVSGPLAARFVEASAARTTDPGPTRRGRSALLAGAQQRDTRPPRVWHSRERAPAGLGLHTQIRDTGRREAIYEALLADFLDGLCWPLPRAHGDARECFRLDDLPSRGGLDDHDALDCGALVSTDGRPLAWPHGTKVRPPHRLARRVESLRDRSIAWRVDVQRGADTLSVWIGSYHVDPTTRSLMAYGNGEDAWGWRSSAPAWRALGLPKGNHVHLEILGLHEHTGTAQLLLTTWVRTALFRTARAAAQARPADLAPVQAPPNLDPLGDDLARTARSLPVFARILLVPNTADARADRFELRGPPLELADVVTVADSELVDGSVGIRLRMGDRLWLGPLLEGNRPRLAPGRLRLRFDPGPNSLIRKLSPDDQELLIARLMRRIAGHEGDAAPESK
ncbi:MAG: hypothetical protein H6832_00840 [Planctomycetes bacterium]|nr:hypothetical protein [Planctomycetota bacterium]